ncbi:MAG: hypothetical protein A3F68_02270 [Acidobacteria bacterium RIFCSPLOWO2_12_FULL_54_10]|nr:MAG: hypothetical protein A3F68_02270 [Acidobacteria bacterium RIFCSPLOWO2_12_FULL_54_10]
MKISVIICTYNYAHFLKEALRTVAAQNYPYFELLIVDDGSSDDTEQVVASFQNRFRQCRYLKKPHTNLGDSRNFGIAAASGTHIAFLDADDLWSPDYLASMLDVFEQHPEAELVCCNCLCIQGTGLVTGSLFPPGLPSICGPLLTPREIFDFFPFVLPSGMVFTKSLIHRIGLFQPGSPTGAEDWPWVIRAAAQGAFCVRLDRYLVLYRFHGGNLTAHRHKNFEEWLRVCEDLWRDQNVNSEAMTLARKMTRSRIPALLARYPAATNRRLLQHALRVHGPDWILTSANWATYLGLCPSAKVAYRLKKFLQYFAAPPLGLILDLQAAPEALFASIAPQPVAASRAAAAASKSA